LERVRSAIDSRITGGGDGQRIERRIALTNEVALLHPLATSCKSGTSRTFV
jgi:hypothetical protein